MRKFLMKHRQAWVLSYALLYFPWFFALEKNITNRFHVIHLPIDDWIPFCEYFIIPYLLWFAYIAVTIGIFLFRCPKMEFYKLTAYLFIGMTICLAICTVFPNGLRIRPAVDPDKNVFTRLVSVLYQTDTATNVFPSIHVFSSIGVHTAIRQSELTKKYRYLRPISGCLMVSIILSTMFLKQHSVLDVIGAFLLSYLMDSIVYRREGSYQEETKKWISKLRIHRQP